MKLDLRHYQNAAIDAAWNHLATSTGQPVIVLPTGTGKSLVLAEFIRRALTEYPGTRILVLQHVRELISQNCAELIQHWPEAPIGIYSAGLNRKDKRAQVIFASIQSIHKKAFQFQDPPFDLVLVDECHLIPRTASTTYRKFLDDLRQINCFLRVVGLTATPYRMDSGLIHKGDDAIFSSIAYEYNVKDAIADGYLCRPVTGNTTAQIDTTGVGTRGGEFIAGQLEAAAMDPEVIAAIVQEIVTLGADRKGWIVFGCGIAHCEALRDAIRARGYSCEGIFATTPSGERDSIVARFKRQEIRALVSVNALAVGFNAKHVDLVALARATKSAGLYIQAVGRGLRLFPGKDDALIADFGGNIARHGPVDAPFIKDKKKADGDGSAPTKMCPECESLNPISARECMDCGFEFPPVVSKIDTKAFSGALLTTQLKPEWIDVTKVTYARHPGRDGKPDSLRADYWAGMVKHSEWVSIEGAGYARQKACSWWARRAPGELVPNTVEEALQTTQSLLAPIQIQVKPNGKFSEIVAARFG